MRQERDGRKKKEHGNTGAPRELCRSAHKKKIRLSTGMPKAGMVVFTFGTQGISSLPAILKMVNAHPEGGFDPACFRGLFSKKERRCRSFFFGDAYRINIGF